MIAADATFIVTWCRVGPDALRVTTVLTDLTRIERHDPDAPALSTYDEAVRTVTLRGLSRPPRLGHVKGLGVVEYVSVSERVVFDSADVLDAVAEAMVQ